MILGIYYDGNTSRGTSCSMYVSGDGQVHFDGVNVNSYAFADLIIPSRLGNTARVIALPDGGSFETVHNAALDKLVRDHKRHQQHWFNPHAWESRLSLIIVALVVTGALLFSGVKWGLPWLAERLAMSAPENVSVLLAEGALNQMDNIYFEPSTLSPARQMALRQLFFQHLPREQGFNFDLQFRSSELLGANAFALPDGTVVVTDDLIALADSDDELLSVLLHEIGHVVHRHALRGAIQKAGLYGLYSMMTGDLYASSALITLLPVILVDAQYSRALEYEADTYALNTMVATGIPPAAFAGMMEKLEAQISSADFEGGDDDTSGSEMETASEVANEERASVGNTSADIAPTEMTPDETTPVEITTNKNDTGASKNLLRYLSSHPASEERIERFRKADLEK